MAAYTWKPSSHMSGDAQAFGEVCERLEELGELTPKRVVDAARSEESPIHGMFEWDDAIAGEKYRETQAYKGLRSIQIVVKGSAEPTRAYFPIAINDEEPTYRSVEVILRDANGREALLASAMAELTSFKRKYAQLDELADVFAAIDEVTAIERVA